MSKHFHAPVALPLEKEPLVPTGRCLCGRTPEPLVPTGRAFCGRTPEPDCMDVVAKRKLSSLMTIEPPGPEAREFLSYHGEHHEICC